MSESIVHPPGIYFGLDEDEYHADEALGSSSLKELVLDPIEYQHARLHGGEKAENWALRWGSAIHCRVLEGPGAFAQRYMIEPEKSDYPGLLVTMEDLKGHASAMDVSIGRTKASAIAAIRDFDRDVPIWDEIVEKFQADTAGKKTLPRQAVKEVEQAATWMQRNSKLAPIMENGTMVAGASEVSIFYEDRGVRLKLRIDHLLAHAVVDLKSFRPVFSEKVNTAARKAIERMRYDLQAAAYMRGLRAARDLYVQGAVHNNPFDKAFLDTVFNTLDAGEMKWNWVLVKATGAPQSVVRELYLKSTVFQAASNDIEKAISDYISLGEKFGRDQDWMPDHAAEVLSDEDFSPWAFT